MKSISELLEKCSKYEQLTTHAQRIRSVPRATPKVRPTLEPPRRPTPQTVNPTLEPPPRPSAAPKVKPTLEPPTKPPTSPVSKPTNIPAEPTVPKGPKVPKPSEIKFNEFGEPIIQDHWVDASGKLLFDQKALRNAVREAAKTRIKLENSNLVKSKNVGKLQVSLNKTVNSERFKAKLTSTKAKLGFFAVASLSAIVAVFANSQPTSSDTTVNEAIKETSNAATILDAPDPSTVQLNINTLITSLNELPVKSAKSKQIINSYNNMLNNIIMSMQKLNTAPNLDSKQIASAYATEIQNFENLAIAANPKLARLEKVFSDQGNTEMAQQVSTVKNDLNNYIIVISSARTIKTQGT